MRLRIPGIVDLALVRERAVISELTANPALDREFVPKGPLINRLLLSRVCRALTVDGNRLPSIAPRGDSDRSAGQAALQKRLDEIPKTRLLITKRWRRLSMLFGQSPTHLRRDCDTAGRRQMVC